MSALTSIPLIMVHGAGGGGWEWQLWRRVAESRGLSVMTPDLQPGAAGLEQTALDDYQRQLGALTAAHPGCVLIGASLGGLLVMRDTHPVRARIAVNPLVPRSMGGSGNTWPERVAWSASTLQSTVRSLGDAPTSAAVFAQRRWRDESGRVLRDAQNCPALAAPAEAGLIIAAQADADVEPAAMRQFADRLGADHLSVAGASHLGPLMGDSAALCAELALNWLQCAVAAPQSDRHG